MICRTFPGCELEAKARYGMFCPNAIGQCKNMAMPVTHRKSGRQQCNANNRKEAKRKSAFMNNSK